MLGWGLITELISKQMVILILQIVFPLQQDKISVHLVKTFQYRYFDKIRLALVPPNPKELVMACSTLAFRITLGT